MSPVERSLSRNRLGVPLVIGHALSGSAPMTVVAAGMAVGFFVTGNTGLPAMYAVVGLAFALFCVGYVTMSRYLVNAGSFYTYITHGLGKMMGVGAAFIAKIGYNLMQVALYGGIGAVASGYAAARLGLEVSWWWFALASWLVIGLFGLLRIDINGLILGIALAAEIVLIAVYDLVMFANPAAGTYDLSALSPAHLASPSFGAAAVVVAAGFMGFEATTVFSEEAKDPRRTIARATYGSLALIAVVYGLSALAMTVVAGPADIVAVAQAQQANLLFHLVSPHLHVAFVDAGNILTITSMFAAGLSFHNTCARYSFAMGRERVLHPALAATGLKTGAPKGGSLFQSMIGLIAIALFALAGWDPLVHMFFWLATWAALGVVVLMLLTSVAVVAYFRMASHQTESQDEGVWRTTVAPVLATAALGYIVFQTFVNYHNLLGVEAGHPAATWFPAALIVLFVIGVIWAGFLRLARRDAYERIGLGASAAPATTVSSGPAHASTGGY